MNALPRELTLKEGVALAIGSVMGSGILFLPALTAQVSGAYTSWVWFLTTLFCFPLLFIFSDMVKHVKNGSGIEGFVSLGLGNNIGAMIPILLLGTVSLGMPASALIAGEYVKNFFHSGENLVVLTALVLVFSSAITNLIGIRGGAFIQLLVTLITIFVGGLLCFVMSPEIVWEQVLSFPNLSHMIEILPGILIAFWAYAGFENMTFLSSEFKHSTRDFTLSMLIALIACGLLYWLLSLSYYFMGNATAPFSYKNGYLNLIITIFACLVVKINFNSWIWGISRLIYSSANQKKMPAYFSVLNKRKIPLRSIFLLVIIFSSLIILSMWFKNFLAFVIPLVSTNFVFIYLLCLLSYVRFKKRGMLRHIALLSFLLLLPVIFSSGWQIFYPLLLSFVGWIYCQNNKGRM